MITPYPIRFGLNIDHVATIRNARGGHTPDPIRAALLAIKAGVDGITAHLREDRRHITDTDIARLRNKISKPLNFEMAATEEMKSIALNIKPHAVCLVPEKREERTTEGGLDIIKYQKILTPYIAELTGAGIRVSLFIEADVAQIEMAKKIRVPVIELHTGSYCHALAVDDKVTASREFSRLDQGAAFAGRLGLEVHAGHGLDFHSAEQIAKIPEIRELNIGHFIIGEAIFFGLSSAILQMKAAIDCGRAKSIPR